MKQFNYFILIAIAVTFLSSNAFSYKQFLPYNASIIIEVKMKDIDQTFSKIANLFSVTPEKYKKFLDEMNKDMKKSLGEDIVSPDICSITGMDPESNLVFSILEFSIQKPSLIFAIPINNEVKFKDFLNNKLKIASYQNQQIKEKTELYKGFTINIIEKKYKNWKKKEDDKSPPTYREDLAYTIVDNYALFSNSKDIICKAIDNKYSDKNLSNNSAIKELLSKNILNEDIKLSFFINPLFIQKFFTEDSFFFSKNERNQIKPLMDLYNLYGYIWAGFYVKNNKIGLKEVATFNKSHPLFPLLKTLYSTDLSFNKMHKYFPNNGGYGYFAFSSDLGKVFDLLLKNFPFETFLKDYYKMSKEFRTKSGLDIINDFFKKLGKNGGIAFYGIDPLTLKHIKPINIEENNFLAFLELDNNSSAGNIFSGVLSLLKKSDSIKYSTETIEGVGVLKIALDDFNLFIAIYDNYIIAGTSHKSFSDYLRNIKNGTVSLTLPTEVYSEGIKPKNLVGYFKLYDFLNDYGYLKDAPAMNRVNSVYFSSEVQDDYIHQDFAMTFK